MTQEEKGHYRNTNLEIAMYKISRADKMDNRQLLLEIFKMCCVFEGAISELEMRVNALKSSCDDLLYKRYGL